MNEQEIIYTMALTRINYFNLAGLLQLYRELGSATAIIENKEQIREMVPEASPRLIAGLKNIGEALKRAETEWEYDLTHQIQPITLNDSRYPQRLKECDDAPLMLFYKGSADLNQQRVINIVGTRHCTAYGQDLIHQFVNDLRRRCPRVLIVSGMAYGVDIHAHQEALQNGYETVAVLAHGLDFLYPHQHKSTATAMLKQGGLLTEHFTQTNADKINFVKRNRIVAGMSDACILIESAAKGGGLITCRLSREYNRDVFAFPGRIGDEYSEGCNNLIRDNGAALINSAEDFVNAMGWEEDATLMNAQQQGIERDFFPMLSPDETAVFEALKKQNDQPVNRLAINTNLSVGRLTSLLFEMEMKGVVRTMAGGVYHVLK